MKKKKLTNNKKGLGESTVLNRTYFYGFKKQFMESATNNGMKVMKGHFILAIKSMYKSVYRHW